LKADWIHWNRWVLRCFRQVFKVRDERVVEGGEFQTVGAAI